MLLRSIAIPDRIRCMVDERPDIQEQLRQAILAGTMTRYRLAKLTGLSQGLLSLFVNSKRSMTLDTAAKVATVLGLEFRPIKRNRKDR